MDALLNWALSCLKTNKLTTMINVSVKFFSRHLLLLIFALCLSGAKFTTCIAQTLLDKPIRIDLERERLDLAMEKVIKATKVPLMYDPEKLKKFHLKTPIRSKDQTFKQVLTLILKDLPLTFSVSGKSIIIKDKEPTQQKVAPQKSSKDQQKTIKVTGTVRSDSIALADVTVFVSGNSKVTTKTDANGSYTILVPEEAILVFRSLGYVDFETPVSRNNTINVTLREDQNNLGEVVVTAFGRKQRKEAVVGSVASVSGKDLKVPSSNLTTALAGRIAGVVAFQRTGEPGADNANFFIRGIGTFGQGNRPLILVDNVEMSATDLARMQPDDIESFSILKDASATSLYGARGANGVIFISTKIGKEGRAKINIRSELASSRPTQEVQTVDPITHMRLYNEAQMTRDPLAAPKYSQNKIDNTIAGLNPYVYPVVDWKEMLIKNQTLTNRNNISMSGGGKVAQYYVAGTYNVDNGILNVDKRNNFNNNIKLKTYQLRSNVTINVTPNTQAVVRLYGNFDEYNGPIDGGAAIYQKTLRTSPTAYPAYYAPDEANRNTQHILFGNFDRGGAYLNPYADMVRGYKEYSQSKMLAQLELNQKMPFITEGLSGRMVLSTDRYSYFEATRAYKPFFYNVSLYDKATDSYTLEYLNRESNPTEFLDYNASTPNVSTHLYMLTGLDYARSLGAHNLSATVIQTIEQTQSPSSGNSLQLSLPRRNLGISGRASYSFDNRYFTEFSFGYNGSERFHRSRQFGFFPTIGASWILSNEKFWSSLPFSKGITKVKFRGSYGLVGNDAIGSATDRFFYLSEVNMNDGGRGFTTGLNPGDYNRPGISISRYENLDITWEKSYQTNLALELSFFNRLNFIGEVYRQKRTNILQSRANIPTTMGLATAPVANLGEAISEGIDLSLDYSQNFGSDWWVQARANFTLNRGKYLKYEEPNYADNLQHLYLKGSYIGVQRGYIAERLFIDEEDVRNSPKQNFGIYGAGDIKYRDINGDGQISSLDQVAMGYPTTPQLIYGFGASAGFKGFDISMFFQGLGKESFWINAASTSPFINYTADGVNGGKIGENTMLTAYADSYWSEDNRNIYAMWPRLSTELNVNNTQTSSWFMRNGSFLRLKSAELGYSLSKTATERLKMSSLRFYLSGTNLLVFRDFKLWDPEMGGNGLGYPVQKVFNIGVNVNF